MSEINVDDYKDLGYANGWKTDPPEEVVCESKKHKKERVTKGNCLTLYYCPICKIKWMVDSSG